MERRELAASDGERLDYAVWPADVEHLRTIAVLHCIAFTGQPYVSIAEDLPLDCTRFPAL